MDMRELVHRKDMVSHCLWIDLELGDAQGSIDDWIKVPAKIDTGMNLPTEDGVLVAALVPKVVQETVDVIDTSGMVEYVLADGSSDITMSFLALVRVVGDNGSWPPGRTEMPIVFLRETGHALVGSGLWSQWSIDIDGPNRKFSIKVPADDV